MYSVTKDADGQYVAHLNDPSGVFDSRLLGRRPKYKMAQRLCEQTAGRSLTWKSLGGGNYVGR